MVFLTGNGWLGTPMGGWELKSSPLLLVTQLRGYAVTHMVLYVQLYPLFIFVFLVLIKKQNETRKITRKDLRERSDCIFEIKSNYCLESSYQTAS